MRSRHELETAYNDYWTAKNTAEDRSAYYRILFFGGIDGWSPTDSKIRQNLARWLRQLALRVEQR